MKVTSPRDWCRNFSQGGGGRGGAAGSAEKRIEREMLLGGDERGAVINGAVMGLGLWYL
jgi:hypothetical protein